MNNSTQVSTQEGHVMTTKKKTAGKTWKKKGVTVSTATDTSHFTSKPKAGEYTVSSFKTKPSTAILQTYGTIVNDAEFLRTCVGQVPPVKRVKFNNLVKTYVALAQAIEDYLG